MLIDMIGCIDSLVGEEGMANPALTPLYFPYIYQLLNSVDDTDMRLYPIMECLVCVLPVMGMESQPYILTIYKRYLQLLGMFLHNFLRLIDYFTSMNRRTSCCHVIACNARQALDYELLCLWNKFLV